MILNPKEELEIYLTQIGLKPACLLGRCLTKKGIVRKDRVSFPEEGRELLKNIGKPFCERANIYHGEMMLNFYVGRNEKFLDRLVNANTDPELGLALGYPLDATESFLKSIEGEVRTWEYVYNQIRKTIGTNIPIPDWIAYISHVPAYFDLVNGIVSESSKMQGEFYESYVRRNNPRLAERVLKIERLSWEKLAK